MHQYRFLLPLLTFVTLLTSCNTDDKSAQDNEQAYLEYKNFVTEVERDTVVKESDLGVEWESRTDSLMQVSETHRKIVVDRLDGFEAERREEVNAFDERLQAAFEERQRKYDEISYRYKLRREMLNIEVSEDDLSNINAGNIADTYEHFVNTLEDKLPTFTTKEWELTEGWWSALENRRQGISGEISPADQQKISKQQEIYRQIREKAFAENTAAVTE